MILYPIWYRKHGIRRPADLVAPRFSKVEHLILPKESLFHYYPEDDVEYGLPGDDWFIKNDDRLVMVEHVIELADKKGSPKPLPVVPLKLVREYHRKNKRVRWLKNKALALSNPKTIIVENYAILNHLVRYTTSFFAGYYKWYNVRATLWDNVNKIAKETDRQQYIKCLLPDVLPSLADLRKIEKRFDRTTLEKFKNVESLNFSDLWIWLGENRTNSLINKVDVEHLDKVNLIWISQDRWFVLNLGMLNDWRAEEDSDGIDPVILQKRFLKLAMTLYETTTVSGDQEVRVNERTEKQAAASSIVKDEGSVDELHKESENFLSEDINIFKVDDYEELKLEEELDALNDLHKKIEEQIEQDTDVVTLNVKTPTKDFDFSQNSKSKINDLAESGVLSAAEYKRNINISEAYKDIKNPYGEGLLIEEANITHEDITLKDITTFPDNVSVHDKSMLQNSIVDFDKKYITKVMKKDILNSVLNIQNAGLSITDYKVERIESVLGDSEIHKVKIVPINGSPSTISFRLPVVNENGIYVANGVKYKLRRQRGD